MSMELLKANIRGIIVNWTENKQALEGHHTKIMGEKISGRYTTLTSWKAGYNSNGGCFSRALDLQSISIP